MLENIRISQELSRLNLSFSVEDVFLETYWCRLAIKEAKTFMSKKHFHSFFELHICIKGSAEFVFGTETVILREGDFIFIPRNIGHQVIKVSDDFVKMVWGFNIMPKQGEKSALYNKLVFITELKKQTVAPYSRKVLTILSLLLENVKEREIAWILMVKQHVFQILMECVRALMQKSGVLTQEDEIEYKAGIDVIKAYIMDNMSNGVTVSDLAQQFACSERQLSRICNRQYGMPPKEYIRSLQMSEARRLLCDLDLSISDVASLVGYADYYAFCKAFKKMEGLSPARFREGILK